MCTFLCEFFGAFFATVRGILSTKATLFRNKRFMHNEIVFSKNLKVAIYFDFGVRKSENPNR